MTSFGCEEAAGEGTAVTPRTAAEVKDACGGSEETQVGTLPSTTLLRHNRCPPIGASVIQIQAKRLKLSCFSLQSTDATRLPVCINLQGVSMDCGIC